MLDSCPVACPLTSTHTLPCAHLQNYTQEMEKGQLGVKALCRGPGCELKAHMEGDSQLPMIPAPVYT